LGSEAQDLKEVVAEQALGTPDTLKASLMRRSIRRVTFWLENEEPISLGEVVTFW
jgi:hypothetical protein